MGGESNSYFTTENLIKGAKIFGGASIVLGISFFACKYFKSLKNEDKETEEVQETKVDLKELQKLTGLLLKFHLNYKTIYKTTEGTPFVSDVVNEHSTSKKKA